MHRGPISGVVNAERAFESDVFAAEEGRPHGVLTTTRSYSPIYSSYKGFKGNRIVGARSYRMDRSGSTHEKRTDNRPLISHGYYT